MNSEDSRYVKDNIKILLSAALIFTSVMLTWSIWYSYQVYDNAVNTSKRQFQTERLRGTIRHLDEVVNMSLRMAAASGDVQWHSRYSQFQPALHDAINEAVTLLPDISIDETNSIAESMNVISITVTPNTRKQLGYLFSSCRKMEKNAARKQPYI